jgi:predicted ATP-binding protein involved in virulence
MESKYPVSLVASGMIERQLEQWSRELTGEKTQTTFGKAKVIIDYAKKLQQQVRADEQVSLPIIAYYGTGRLWKQTQASNRPSAQSHSRLYGYHDALNPNSTYKAFEKWFTDKSLAEYHHNLIKNLNNLENNLTNKVGYKHSDESSNYSTELEHVRKAVDKCMCMSVSGWRILEYDLKWRELVVRLNHGETGFDSFIPAAQLSDGVKAMLSLTADIAYRCVQLNPHLASPTEETNGIVLIDEVDLHLYPKWQQTVLSDLQKAFPNIQFIVTTHSPQVLSSVHRESIRLLGKDNAGHDVAVMPMAESYGEISSDVLESIMHVNPQPPVAEKVDLDRLTAWVDQGQYNTPEAISLFAELKAVFGETHPQLQKLERSIQRQELLKS